jgi:hypothetical protein
MKYLDYSNSEPTVEWWFSGNKEWSFSLRRFKKKVFGAGWW